MAAGLQITNTSGVVTIGADTPHFVCLLKRTIQVPSGGQYSNAYKLTSANCPVFYDIIDGGLFAPDYKKFRDNPMVFIGAVSHGGRASFQYSTQFSTNNEFGWINAVAPGVAAGTLISVTFYLFSTKRPVASGARFGLQVFNAQGVLEFDSAYRLLQIQLIAKTASDSWSVGIPTGREYAAAIAGNNYWTPGGGQVWGPGIKNSGKGGTLGIQGMLIQTANPVAATARPLAQIVVADVTGAT